MSVDKAQDILPYQSLLLTLFVVQHAFEEDFEVQSGETHLQAILIACVYVCMYVRAREREPQNKEERAQGEPDCQQQNISADAADAAPLVTRGW